MYSSSFYQFLLSECVFQVVHALSSQGHTTPKHEHITPFA